MSTPKLQNRRSVAVDAGLIKQFQHDFHGQVIHPDDHGYDAARRIWNASIDKRPGLIARCTGAADIVHAIKFARTNDLLVAVRGGGHNVAGRALCDDGLVIDLSLMKGVFVDRASRTVRVQPGATLGDVDRETHLEGLAIPTGVISRTGIAGLTLGGGVGWLTRKYGLTCDNVLSFEVVTAEGQLLEASAGNNADLFWGLRGGGGNFGIVTSFLYRAHPVSTVVGGLIAYRRDRAAAIIRNYRDFMASAPDELTIYAGLLCLPDGTPAVGLMACHCGDPVEGGRVLRPLRALGSPLVDTIQRMPFPLMQKLADQGSPEGNCNYWRSTFVRELHDDLIDLLVEQASRAHSPLSRIIIQLFGGAVRTVRPVDSAFAQRQPEYNIGIEAQWTDPHQSASHISWAREAANALQPYSSGGYLLNFLGDEGPDAVRAALADNYARLVELKTQYDPTNFFSLNQNITPLTQRSSLSARSL